MAAPAQDGPIGRLALECLGESWPEDWIARHRDRFLVAMEGEALLGYALVTGVLDEASLDSIAVCPQWRRHGLGQALLTAVIGRCRAEGMATLTLEVRRSNGAAVSLYEKNGFVQVGCRRGYYEKPREDALLLTLTLAGAE